MDKILIITPHLSTGGLPQFLLEKIQILKSEYNVYLIEWDNITGGVFVVQRDKITKILGDKFYSLSDDKNQIFNIIKNINPNIIHFEEFSETFIDRKILTEIYSNKDYFITETTHGTSFNINDKTFIPDKLMFVSKGNYMQYGAISDSEVIEYPSKLQKRHQGLKKLGLDPDFKHILNVGLFTSGKNQAEIFEIAKNMLQYKIQFHFVGNQAGNFENYWRPLMSNKPENCIVWGEKENVEDFYKSMDLFLYTSKWENRPLSVLEAINYDMKVLMYNLENYGDTFANNPSVSFLTNDRQTNISIILESINVEKNIKTKKKEIESKNTINAYHMLTDIDSDREVQSLISLSKLRSLGIIIKHV